MRSVNDVRELTNDIWRNMPLLALVISCQRWKGAKLKFSEFKGAKV